MGRIPPFGNVVCFEIFHACTNFLLASLDSRNLLLANEERGDTTEDDFICSPHFCCDCRIYCQVRKFLLSFLNVNDSEYNSLIFFYIDNAN